MEKVTQILILICFTYYCSDAQKISNLEFYEDENIIIDIQYYNQANILDKRWLSLVFHNKTKYSISIKNFEYSTEYDTVSIRHKNYRKRSLGKGNKYDVFPLYESKSHASSYDISIKPNETITCYRSISNYASVLLGYDNLSAQKIYAKAKAKCKYIIKQEEFDIEFEAPEFDFTWTTPNKDLLVDRFVDSCDSLHLRGNNWIANSLSKDLSVTSQISESTYVQLITKRVLDSHSSGSCIQEAFVKNYGSNIELNALYSKILKNSNWTFIYDLYYYWDDSLLEPLIYQFKQNYDNSIKCLIVLDKNYDLWKENTEVKSELYRNLKASRRLSFDLSPEDISFWLTNLKYLKMTHSKEAEEYFKTFFDNQFPLYNETLNRRRFNSYFYPSTRVCDAAIDAFIYSKYDDVNEVYTKKYNELVERGLLEKPELNKRYYWVKDKNDLYDEKTMQVIWSELIKDYR